MAGNNVIYLPETPTFGGELGKGVGRGLSTFADNEMKRQQDAMDAEKNMRALNMIKQAGSRQKALEILSTPGLAVMKNATELQGALRFVDEMFPVTDLTPVEMKGYDKDTGAELSGHAPRAELLNPGTFNRVLGPNATKDKPEMTEFFDVSGPDGTFKSTGIRPRTNNPAGDFTKTEIDLIAAREKEARADQRASEQSEAAKRAAKAAERTAAASEEGSMERTARINTMMRTTLLDLFNAKKIGANGEIIADFGGDAKKQASFLTALEEATKQVKTDKTGDINAAAVAAARKHGVGAERPKEPEAPPKPPGKLEQLKAAAGDKIDAAKRAVGLGDKEETLTEMPKDTSKLSKGKYYNTPSGRLKWTGTGWVK